MKYLSEYKYYLKLFENFDIFSEENWDEEEMDNSRFVYYKWHYPAGGVYVYDTVKKTFYDGYKVDIINEKYYSQFTDRELKDFVNGNSDYKNIYIYHEKDWEEYYGYRHLLDFYPELKVNI